MLMFIILLNALTHLLFVVRATDLTQPIALHANLSIIIFWCAQWHAKLMDTTSHKMSTHARGSERLVYRASAFSWT